VRKAVGSNQYVTKPGITTVVLAHQPDLMSQINHEVVRLRCHQVWGGRCQTWVSAPAWGHGLHQAYHKLIPDNIEQLPDPDFILRHFELSEPQSAALARNRHLSFDGLCTLLQGPHGKPVALARTHAWSKWPGKPGNTAQDCTLEPGGWTDERWAKLIAVWPGPESLSIWMRWSPRNIWRQLVYDTANAAEVRQLARRNFVHNARSMELITVGERDQWPDSAWADVWKGMYIIRINPSLCLKALEHLKRAGPNEMAALADVDTPVAANKDPLQKQWISTMYEAMMRNLGTPGATDAVILRVAYRLAAEQDDSLTLSGFGTR